MLIERLTLAWARGLSVLTGETGAGKSILLDALGLALGSLGNAAWAGPDEDMAKAGCTACHTKDKKLVGPAYQEVAKKYKGNKDAEAALTKKVIAGGSGVWGTIPMPPNNVPEGDIKTMARHLDLDELTVHNNGKTIKFNRQELQTVKNGGKGWGGG